MSRPLGLSQVRNSNTFRLPWCYVKHLCKVGNVSIAPFCRPVSASDWPLLLGGGPGQNGRTVMLCVTQRQHFPVITPASGQAPNGGTGPSKLLNPLKHDARPLQKRLRAQLSSPILGCPTFRLWLAVRPPRRCCNSMSSMSRSVELVEIRSAAVILTAVVVGRQAPPQQQWALSRWHDRRFQWQMGHWDMWRPEPWAALRFSDSEWFSMIQR